MKQMQKKMPSKWMNIYMDERFAAIGIQVSNFKLHSASPNWSSCLHSATPLQEILHCIIPFWNTIVTWSVSCLHLFDGLLWLSESWTSNMAYKYPSWSGLSFLIGPPYVYPLLQPLTSTCSSVIGRYHFSLLWYVLST